MASVQTLSWWFVKIRLKFCVFVFLVLPCSCLHSSNTVFLFQKTPPLSQNYMRPNISETDIRSSPLWTSLLFSVPNNHSQDATFHYKERGYVFDRNNNSDESTLFRRGREAHRSFMQRIAPHRIAPPPVPKLPPSRTHILQHKLKRPHLHFHEHPHILKHQTLIGAASISSLSSTDLGLPDNIAHEYIDGVNPPKFLGRPETDLFDHHNEDIRKTTHNELNNNNNKKKPKPFSTTVPKLNTLFIVPGTQADVPILRPILPPDNNNYAPSPIRSTNDSINSILNHIRAKQKFQDIKHPIVPGHTKQPNTSVITNGEFRPSTTVSHQPVQMTPVTVSVSPEKAPSTTEPQKSSSDPHSTMKLDLSLMLKQEFDAKNAELNRTSLFTIDDSALDHFRLVGHVPSSTVPATSIRPDRERVFYSGTPRVRSPPSTVVSKKATKRPSSRPNIRQSVKKNETKNYHRIKPPRRNNGPTTVTTTTAPSTTTEEIVVNLSQAPATTNVRWEPPKDITAATPESTVPTDVRTTSTTGSPINEFELTFNDLDLNVDESRNDMGTNHSKIDWFATFDTGRRRRVNGPNDTLSATIPVSGSTPFRLTTERLAYILIGSCCGLSLLCLIVVAMSVRCRDVCDDYRSWKSADKRWQARRLRPGIFVRPPGPQSFFPYPSTLLRATGVLPRYLRAAVMGEKPKINEQPPPVNMNNSPTGQCCHCVNCSSTWFFRNVKQGDWCCQRGYLEPPKRNKLPFGAASSVNTFMAKDDEYPLEEHETRPKRLMMHDEETEEDEDFDEQPEDDEGDEIATDFSNLFDSHHHMHMHYNPNSMGVSNMDHMSPGRNKLKPSQLEPFECSQHEQLRQKSEENKQQQEWAKATRMEKMHRKNQIRRDAESSSNSRTRFAVPKQLNVRRQQQQKHGITKASSSHHRPRFKVQLKQEPSVVSFLHPPNTGPYERPVLHHHFDPIVGPMVFTGRYPDLGPPPATATTAAHLHHMRSGHPGSMHPPNVSVIWNSNDSERLI